MEYLGLNQNNYLMYWWFDYTIWLMLQYKFMAPANMISANDDMQDFLKHFSLNGIKQFNLCRQ